MIATESEVLIYFKNEKEYNELTRENAGSGQLNPIGEINRVSGIKGKGR